ncbi:MAG: DUF6240 domain-containing protein [Clostridia bacterium]|jgi:hypothetical protein|nr:DUF6240 domain-containing protein [Clostridia bacterium]
MISGVNSNNTYGLVMDAFKMQTEESNINETNKAQDVKVERLNRKVNKLEDVTYITKTLEKYGFESNKENVKAFNNLKKNISKISNTLTEGAVKDILAQKTLAENMSIDELNNFLSNQDKVNSENVEVNNDNEDKSDMEEYNEVIEALFKAGLPMTGENMSKLKNVENVMDKVKSISDDAIVISMKNEKITPESLYKNSNAKIEDKKSEIKDINSEIGKVLEKNGIENTVENNKIAKKLFNTDSEITPENIENIKVVKENISKDNTLKLAVEDMKIGKEFINKDLTKIDLRDLKEVLDNVSEEIVDKLEKLSQKVNLKNIYLLEKGVLGRGNEKIFNSDYKTVLELKAKLTFEAITKLINSDIEIATKDIKEVIDILNDLEKIENEQTLKKYGVEIKETNLDKLTNYNKEIKTLKNASSEVFRVIENKEIENTLEAINKYEESSTEKRVDLGDKVSKVFPQIESFLEKNGIKSNELNKEVAKILIKNDMEITKDNVENIKNIKLKMDYISNNFTVDVATNFIKEGIEFSSMNLDKLKTYIKDYVEANGPTLSDNIAKEIYELGKDGKINELEKKELTEVYKSIYRVNKTKGKVIGFMVKNNMDFTMENLVKASNYILDKTEIDAYVDENFGFLERENKEMVLEDILTNIDRYNIREVKGNVDFEELYMKKMDKKVDIEEVRKIISDINELSKETYDFMDKNDIKFSSSNIKLVGEILKNAYVIGENLEKVKKLKDEKIEKIVSKTIERLEKGEDIEEIVNDIKENAEIIFEETFDNLEKLEGMQKVQKIFELRSSMDNSNMYEVPIKINDKITNLNMVLLSENVDDNMSIVMMLKTDELGEIGFYIEKQDKEVELTISGKKEGIENLNEGIEDAFDAIRKIGLNVNNVKYKVI